MALPVTAVSPPAFAAAQHTAAANHALLLAMAGDEAIDVDFVLYSLLEAARLTLKIGDRPNDLRMIAAIDGWLKSND